MSVSTTTATPAAARSLPLRWIAGGGTAAAVAAAVAIAVWPASATDKARDDGERFGAAVARLQSATSFEEVDAAKADLRDAAATTRDHAGDAVAGQVDDQLSALDRAADGAYGAATAADGFTQDVYDSELDSALDDLASQADEFRATGPEVQQAFWNGYEDGVS